MLKIGLAGAPLIVFCLAAVACVDGDPIKGRDDSAITSSVMVVREPADAWQNSTCTTKHNCQVIWRADPTGANPFGVIPTQWTTRPQLLPLTWDVRTALASEGATRARLVGH